MLARSNRLTSGDEIRDVIKRGQRYSTPHFVLHYLSGETNRFAVITGKTLGGAVQRNKIKRRITNAVRNELKSLSAPINGVFRMRSLSLTCNWQELEASVAEAFSRISK